MRCELPLGDVCDQIVDCAHKTAPESGAPYAYAVGTKAVLDGRIVFSRARPVDAATYAAWTERATPQPGDLILCREARVGPVAMVPRAPLVCLGQRTVLLRPNPRVANPRFLLYTLLAPSTRSALHALSEGSTVAHLNVRAIRTFRVAMPPLLEQERVVSVLGALDDKIDSNWRLRRRSDEVAADLFRASIGRDSAEQTTVGALVRQRVLYISDGLRAKNSELSAEGFPFARARNLNDGFDFTGADRVPEALASAARSKCSLPGDVVFTSKGTVGRFALVDQCVEPFVYSPQLSFWRSLNHGRLPPVLLFWWMQGPEAKRQFDALKGQTDMADYVSLRDQMSMSISLPPHHTVRSLKAALEPLAALGGGLEAESDRLAGIRDALLPKLVSGEIRVPDTADPAEVIEPAAETLAAAS